MNRQIVLKPEGSRAATFNPLSTAWNLLSLGLQKENRLLHSNQQSRPLLYSDGFTYVTHGTDSRRYRE